MADFAIAYAPLKEYEGGYDNDDPDDRSGETYCGIARNFFPSWPGWAIVDREKAIAGGNIAKMKKGLANTEIASLVADWYKKEWWDKLGLATLPQNLANEIFEQAINLGKAGCGNKVQQICNAYNYLSNNPLFPDLVVDGAIGPKTLSALSILIQKSKATAEQLVHALNCMQGAHYIELAAKKPSQRVFTVGWMKRTYCENQC